MNRMFSALCLALPLGNLLPVSAQGAVVDFTAATTFGAAMTVQDTIDFNSLTGFLQPNPVTLNGVDFISSDGSGLFNSVGFGLPGVFLAAQNSGFMIMDFASGITAVGFEFAPLNSSATATFEVFSGTTSLGSFTRAAPDDVFSFFGVTSSSGDITRISFSFSDSEFETVENLVFGAAGTTQVPPVPLPAAGWMLLAGLGGLAAMGRRKSS